MAADQLLYPMDFTGRQDEWLEFDSLFQLPSDYLDSNPTSVESISPRDLEQTFTEADLLNWESEFLSSQTMFPDFAGFEAPMEGLGEQLDFQSFINPNDSLAVPSQFDFDDSGFNASCPTGQEFEHSLFRSMVESQAALDTRCFSQKEKRRDASIALHMQRMDAPLPEQNTPSLASNHLPSPDWSVSSLEMPGGQSPAVTSTASQSPSTGAEPAAAMELVLDLNMNTTTNVPKKQKPRSRAQRENYIKARKYGVCEKHRKQHKRCNCLEKAAVSHLNANASRDAVTISGLQTGHERMLIQKSPRTVRSTTAANVGLARLQDQPIRPTQPATLSSPTLPLTSTSGDQLRVRRPVDESKLNLVNTQQLQTSASSSGHQRQHPFTGSQSFTASGLLNIPARNRHGDSQGGLQSRQGLGLGQQLCQTPSFPLDSRSCHACTNNESHASTRRLHMSVYHSQKASQDNRQHRQGVREEQLRQPSHQSLVQFTSGLHSTTTVQNVRNADILRQGAAPAAGGIAGGFGGTVRSSVLTVIQRPAAVAARAGSFLGRFAVFSSRLLAQYRKGMGLI